MVLRMDINHMLYLHMDAGWGMNTKVELLALWGLLYFAKRRHISGLLVMGDSKVVVDWAMEVHSI